MHQATVLWKRLHYKTQSCDTLHDATEETWFSTARVDNSLLGNKQRPMGCLGDNDVVRDAIEEMSQAVFSASSLKGYNS
jgi:hypothetical protein